MADLPGGAQGGGATGRPEAGVGTFELNRTFNLAGELPLDILPPEAIERLRAGGALSPDEMALVRSAALGDAGIVGKMIETALASGAFELEASTDTIGQASPRSPRNGRVVVPGSARTFTWTWRPGDRPSAPEGDPATYYEMLSGKPHPRRDYFITARRVLDLLVWVVALGLPVILIGLAVATGEAPDTIFMIGVLGLIVGLMLARSVPRLPFR